jgi:DNA modification methylase
MWRMGFRCVERRPCDAPVGVESRAMADNKLYYGDNLAVLREHVKDESIDLIYLDPPFNSRQDYNVLFAEKDGTKAAAQIMAFEDTWEWNLDAERAYEEIVERGGRVSDAMRAFRTFLGQSDMMAYLAMMAPRLMELHRVLKVTGSIYLHCDPTASHYLKMLMDAVFGPQYLRSEIIWKRSSAHSDVKQGLKNFGHIHDVVLFYANGEDSTWNTQFTAYDESYAGRDYGLVDEDTGRRFRRDNLTAARPGGDTEYEWRVKKHAGVHERWVADLDDEYLNPSAGWEYAAARPYQGRYWAYSKENMRRFAAEGRLRHTFDGMPEYKRYLDEMPGVPLQDIWTDLTPIVAGTAERLGYPTQKPETLLERIITASSNEGDTVLDPFCGCGTAISVAQRLNRRWIGIDITHLAIGLIKKRLDDAFGESVRKTYEVIGEPVDLAGAQELADHDPYQFQWWSLSLVGARPLEKKKGADQGIDGRLYFHDEAKGGKTKQIIFSVKAGHVQASHVRDLRGVIEREKAEIGALISMESATKPMLKEAVGAGFYQPPGLADKYPRLQLLSIEELFKGKRLEYPRLLDATFKKAPRAREKAAETIQLPLVDGPTDEPF